MVSVLTGERLFTCEFASDGPTILAPEFSPRSITDPSSPMPTGLPVHEPITEIFVKQIQGLVLILLRLASSEILVYKSFGEFPNRFERVVTKGYTSIVEYELPAGF
jgi:hypothetical protein